MLTGGSLGPDASGILLAAFRRRSKTTVRTLSDSPIEVEYALGQRLAGLLTYASANLSGLPGTFSSGAIELSSQRLQLRGSGGFQPPSQIPDLVIYTAMRMTTSNVEWNGLHINGLHIKIEDRYRRAQLSAGNGCDQSSCNSEYMISNPVTKRGPGREK